MRSHPVLRDGHQIKLLQGGADFFPELIRALDAARSHIQLETYIFDFHGDGAYVAAALERAGRRGVRVWVVVDGVGTPKLKEEWRTRFDSAGVEWRVYSPLGTLGLLIPSRWRRLHRKLCVVDGHVAFCGGINILDDLYDPQHGTLKSPAWTLRFAPRVLWCSKYKRRPRSFGGACKQCAMCGSKIFRRHSVLSGLLASTCHGFMTHGKRMATLGWPKPACFCETTCCTEGK